MFAGHVWILKSGDLIAEFSSSSQILQEMAVRDLRSANSFSKRASSRICRRRAAVFVKISVKSEVIPTHSARHFKKFAADDSLKKAVEVKSALPFSFVKRENEDMNSSLLFRDA
jgi:hypothetical protein